jgi:hypothetical protein
MRRILPAGLIAMCMATASVGAQDATIKSKTTIKAEDGKAATLTGCLAGGPTGFTLATAVAGDAHEGASVPHERSSPAVGTSGVVATYDLTPRDGVDLSTHVGQKVEITGAMVDAATKGDKDATIAVKDKTTVKTDDAPDQKVETKTKAEIPRGVTPRFTVTSVRMVAAGCE